MSGSKRDFMLASFLFDRDRWLWRSLRPRARQDDDAMAAGRPTTSPACSTRRRATPGTPRRSKHAPTRAERRRRPRLQDPHHPALVSPEQPILVPQRSGRRQARVHPGRRRRRHSRAGVRPPEARGRLAKASGSPAISADKLPFDAIEFADDLKSVRFRVGETTWRCDLGYLRLRARPTSRSSTAVGSRAPANAGRGAPGPSRRRRSPRRSSDRSPDKKWTAFIKDHNVYLRREGETAEIKLSDDGKDGLAYGRLAWSPDSKTLVAFRIEPGERKEVYLIQSSPPGGGRAKLRSRRYPLPGDKFTAYELNLFDVDAKKCTKPKVDRVDFESPRLRWRKDGRHFTYEKIDRGHQRFRLIEVDSHTGDSRNLIDEKTNTFIWTAHREALNVGTVTWLDETDEIIYVSERDGWRHLYLIDANTGKLKNLITQGDTSCAASTRSTRPSARSGFAPAARTRARIRISSITTA